MKRYIAIDVVAMHENGLSPVEWMLLENINFLSNNETGYCHASKKDLMEYLGVSNGQIYKMIGALSERGFIKKHDASGSLKTTRKWLEISSGDSLQKMESESPKNGKKVSKKWNLSLQKMETLPIKKEIKGDIKGDNPLPLIPKKVQEWIEYRKEIRKPIKQATIKKLIDQHKKDPHSFGLSVDHSIANGYQGLFAPKGQQQADGVIGIDYSKFGFGSENQGLLPEGAA